MKSIINDLDDEVDIEVNSVWNEEKQELTPSSCEAFYHEKLTFKVSQIGLNIPTESIVRPVNPVATIWGEFRNQLSVNTFCIKLILDECLSFALKELKRV